MAATGAAFAQTLNSQTQQQNMIQLEAVEKVYRTERIETVALTNINLTVRSGVKPNSSAR